MWSGSNLFCLCSVATRFLFWPLDLWHPELSMKRSHIVLALFNASYVIEFFIICNYVSTVFIYMIPFNTSKHTQTHIKACIGTLYLACWRCVLTQTKEVNEEGVDERGGTTSFLTGSLNKITVTVTVWQMMGKDKVSVEIEEWPSTSSALLLLLLDLWGCTSASLSHTLWLHSHECTHRHCASASDLAAVRTHFSQALVPSVMRAHACNCT